MSTTNTDNNDLVRDIMGEYSISLPNRVRTGRIGREIELEQLMTFDIPYTMVKESLDFVGEDITRSIAEYVSENAVGLTRWERKPNEQKGLLLNLFSGLVNIINSERAFISSPHEIMGEPISREDVYDVCSKGSYEIPLSLEETKEINSVANAKRNSEDMTQVRDHGWGALELR